MNGKGDKQRPRQIPRAEFDARWEAINWKKPEHCPHCPDQGWYVVPNTHTGEPEQEQCEFCYTNPNSVFNRTKNDA